MKSDLSITEEHLDVAAMQRTTTGQVNYDTVEKTVSKNALPWENLVGLTTDVVPAMCEKKGLCWTNEEQNAKNELSHASDSVSLLYP